jgi:hypothetical protein
VNAGQAPRAIVLKLTDHPGPSTRALQRCVMLVLLDLALLGFRAGHNLRKSLLG